MTTISKIILFLYLIICATCVFIGLDLKKWFSWLFGILGFIGGFLIGLQITGARGGFTMGVLFAFMVLYGGATSYWHRQRFGKKE
jgi:hypothetical protein